MEMYKEINKVEPQESFKKITKNVQEIPNNTLTIKSVDNEHETQITRNPDKVSSVCGR